MIGASGGRDNVWNVKAAPMSIGGIVPGWLIGYLVAEDALTCDYRVLPVVSVIASQDGTIEPVVMTPDGQTLRASVVGERAFAVGPGEDAYKAALAHAHSRKRLAVRGVAAA